MKTSARSLPDEVRLLGTRLAVAYSRLCEGDPVNAKLTRELVQATKDLMGRCITPTGQRKILAAAKALDARNAAVNHVRHRRGRPVLDYEAREALGRHVHLACTVEDMLEEEA